MHGDLEPEEHHWGMKPIMLMIFGRIWTDSTHYMKNSCGVMMMS
jgi:hypothetical protein